MSLFKCKMCGGTLEISNNETVATCEYCGTQQTLPRLENDRRVNLYDRANHFRRSNEFDKAMSIYEQILNEDGADCEAYWSLVLCRYGIEYVDDPTSRRRIPTVNRAQFTSVFDDDNYKAALQYADDYQRNIYREEAKAINEIQKGILAISQKEEPFDVFICYKETDNSGRRTPDSVLANDLYHQLSQEGFKVFFARITLEDKLGSAYEPYIFAALNSAKVMVALGTKPEYFNAVWVKNEWSRYLALIKQGQKKMLIPAYKDMDPYDLPDEFSHLQAQDMSKLGFMQDLIRGIKKITQTEKPVAVERVMVARGNASVLVKRAELFLEDGNVESANEYCEKALDIHPEYAEAYVIKLLIDLGICTREALNTCAEPFDDNTNYHKAIRFGDDALRAELNGSLEYIKTRNENARLNGIYTSAVAKMKAAKLEKAFIQVAQQLEAIADYMDARVLAEQCREMAEVARKDAILVDGKNRMTNRTETVKDYEDAIQLFRKIPGWKDADERIVACEAKIAALNAKAEEERLEKERLIELARQQMIKQQKRNKLIAIVTSAVLVAGAAIVALWIFVLSPMLQYDKAQSLLDAGSFDEAIVIFTELEDYKDAPEKVFEAKYAKAENFYTNKYYDAAIAIFAELEQYSDAAERVNATKYAKAEAFLADKDFDNAIAVFAELKEYSDAAERVNVTKYAKAEHLLANNNYDASIEIFKALKAYSDSAERVNEVNLLKAESLIKDGSYEQAAAIYKRLGNYKDCEKLYAETIHSYVTVLMKKNDLGKAENQLRNLAKCDGYAEIVDALYICIMETYCEQKQYGSALATYKKTKDYSTTSDLYKDLTYRYADSLFVKKDYSAAKTAYKSIPGYLDVDKQIQECDYQQGLDYMADKKYIGAVNSFKQVEKYRDSKEKIKEAKYLFVKANLSNTNTTTYSYLKDLKSAKYKDSADIFKKLYAWKIEVIAVNSNPDDKKTNKSSISVYDPVYFHFKVTGGEPGAEITLKAKYYMPNGDTGWYTFTWDVYNGATLWYGWENGIYTNPAYGTRGTLKVKFYDENGNMIGEGSVRMTS